MSGKYTQWKYYKYIHTFRGVTALSGSLALMALHRWFFGTWIQVYMCTAVHHCEIQIHKFTKNRKFDPLQRLVAALCLTGRVGEYVEDTIVKIQLWRYTEDTHQVSTLKIRSCTIPLDIADVSQIGKQNTQQLIRRTKRVCKDSLSVTAGYGEGTDTQWRISHWLLQGKQTRLLK